MLHHDSSPPHLVLPIREFLTKQNIPLVSHPPYSLDLALSDFFLFSTVKGTHQESEFQKETENIKSAACGFPCAVCHSYYWNTAAVLIFHCFEFLALHFCEAKTKGENIYDNTFVKIWIFIYWGDHTSFASCGKCDGGALGIIKFSSNVLVHYWFYCATEICLNCFMTFCGGNIHFYNILTIYL
jgi:hypothetical protein